MMKPPHKWLAVGGLALLLTLLAGLLPAAADGVCGADLTVVVSHDTTLDSWARKLGLVEVEAFVKIANHVNQTGRLPPCYLTKQAARARGWHPGRNLWRDAPGHAIGGNIFYNREGRLPKRYSGRYREADLDFAGTARRGAHRLVFVADNPGDWTLWVTLDHYRSFTRIDPR